MVRLSEFETLLSALAIFTASRRCMMWRINYKGMTLQQVLIMAYMNVLDGRTKAELIS